MLEQVFKMSGGDAHVVEAVIKDENIHYMHMVLMGGEALPVHNTNANVYMTVVSGTLSLALGGGEPAEYPARTILKIPYNVNMDARNTKSDVLELIVVKAPAPTK